MTPLIENISIEQKIVLLSSEVNIEDEKASRIRELAKKNIDWDEVINIAKSHGLLFFLYKNLKIICKEYVPDESFVKLKNYYINNTTRNLSLSVKLVRIIKLFKESGIKAVPFKGPVQAETLYGDIGVRSFTDIDILIQKEDAVKARDLLIENDFFLSIEIPKSQLKTYLSCENFFNLFNKNREINIDLHWEITGRYSLSPIYLESIYDRLIEVKLVDQTVFSLCFEDMMIYLCIHGTSHCWEKLELIYSVAEIIKSGNINNWVELDKRAEHFKCQKMMYLGLALARDLFDAVLPSDIEKKITTARYVKSLKNQIVKKLFTDNKSFSESLSWRFSTLHLLIRDKFSDSIKYTLRLLFSPTIREWATNPLPSNLLFLYYILRPFRLLSGLIQNLSIPSSKRNSE